MGEGQAFSYANPILRMGHDQFARQAAAAGVDGVLALDLPIEEAGTFPETLARAGIDLIFLLSPTTTDARIRKAADLGSGFLYGISRLGVTGARDQVASGAEAMVRRIRAHTDLPIALGFGVFQTPPETTATSVAAALRVGYRLIDTAAAYQNEAAVGNAIRKSGLARDELFITTKSRVSDTGYDKTKQAFDRSMKLLGLDVLDLCLIHHGALRWHGKLRVSRAGASTLGELPLFGLPAILAPYPHAWRYQKVNADYMVDQGAAVRLDAQDLEQTLWPTLESLLSDEARLEAMKDFARGLSRPNAAAGLALELRALAEAA